MFTKRKKLLLVLLTVVIVSGIGLLYFLRRPPKKPATIPQGDYSYTIEYAEHRISEVMKQYHLPSVAVALIDDQGIIWQETYGQANIEEEIPASPNTIYKMYSVAKVFTAIEVMRMVEEGLIDLDAPITDYLPEFSIQSRFPDSDPITVRAILAHHAGLPRNGCSAIEWHGEPDIMNELVTSMSNCQMTYPVGTQYKYANIGPNILAAIIQNMRGELFPYYMKDNLLSPIGMESSAFLMADLPTNNDIALGYEYYEGDYYPIDQGDIITLASGNLYATLNDMTRFAQLILNDGEIDGIQIIKPDTLEQMYEDQYSHSQDPQPMGLGWKIAQVFGSERLVWHDGGATEGVGSLVALLPDRNLGVILVANGHSFEGSVSIFLALDILTQMREAKYSLTPPESITPEPIDIAPASLTKYEGKYIVFGQPLEVSLNNNHLQLDFQGIKINLIPISQTHFQPDHWLLRLPLEEYFLLPFDIVRLREMEIEFQVGGEVDADVMILNFSGITYEICPRYPDITTTPTLWNELSGKYDLLYRLPSGNTGDEVFGYDEIQIEDGVLKMPSVIGPILPISETEIIILSGPFAGEVMIYDLDSGTIYHQWVVYKKSTNEE